MCFMATTWKSKKRKPMCYMNLLRLAGGKHSNSCFPSAAGDGKRNAAVPE